MAAWWDATKRVPEEVLKKCVDGWDRMTRTSPMTRDSKHLARTRDYKTGEWVYHVKHLQDRGDREMLEDFLMENPTLTGKVSTRTWKRCKPFYVRKLKHREVCLATEDVHMRHDKEGRVSCGFYIATLPRPQVLRYSVAVIKNSF